MRPGDYIPFHPLSYFRIKRSKISYPCLLLAYLLLVLPACQKDLCDPSPKFDIDLFAENIENAITDLSGYQLTINQNGNLYYSNAEGFAIRQEDPEGAINMTVNTRMNVASVSKFIGAIALMQVLEKHGISIEESIHSYLPPSWKQAMHPDHWDAGSAYRISFRNLLRMETGIAFDANGRMPENFKMLEDISKPAIATRWGVYQNGNFTLIRVLIGEIEYDLDETLSSLYEINCADKYFEYILKNIYDPLGISAPKSVDEINAYYAGIFPRAYQFPLNLGFQDGDGNLGWAATSDPLRNGGSGGLVLSSMDLAAVLAFFMHDPQTLQLSETQRDLILEHELGLYDSATGSNGRYVSKGGTRGPDSNARSLRSRVMIFPNQVEVVLLTNCAFNMMESTLVDAYDDAWKEGC